MENDDILVPDENVSSLSVKSIEISKENKLITDKGCLKVLDRKTIDFSNSLQLVTNDLILDGKKHYRSSHSCAKNIKNNPKINKILNESRGKRKLVRPYSKDKESIDILADLTINHAPVSSNRKDS